MVRINKTENNLENIYTHMIEQKQDQIYLRFCHIISVNMPEVIVYIFQKNE